MSIKNHFRLFCLACCIIAIAAGCQQSQNQEADNREAENIFKPKGNLSDLVYNPVRSDGSIDSSFLPIMTLNETIFDFGTIYEGDIVKKDFTFKNTGTAPLLILNATSSCGCTVPEWPKEPVAIGESGVIKVKFDATNKEGPQNKEVTIFANTYPNRSIITIKGNVEKTK